MVGGELDFGVLRCGERLVWVRTVSCLELESSTWEVKDTVDVGDVVTKTESEMAVEGVVVNGVVYAGVIYS